VNRARTRAAERRLTVYRTVDLRRQVSSLRLMRREGLEGLKRAIGRDARR